MVLPVLIWGGVAVAGALGIGGYSFGKSAGESIGKSLPWVAGSVLVYAAYKAGRK